MAEESSMSGFEQLSTVIKFHLLYSDIEVQLKLFPFEQQAASV